MNTIRIDPKLRKIIHQHKVWLESNQHAHVSLRKASEDFALRIENVYKLYKKRLK